MRRITDHRFEEHGFDEAVRDMVRMAPWWLTSAVIHLIILFILATIPFQVTSSSKGPTMQAQNQDKIEKPEEEELEEPEPEVPEEEIVEEPIETEEISDHNEVDTDSEFEETAGEDGLSDAPFTGPSTSLSIQAV